ncbi:major facilitator superfamily transporter [Coniochaeta ligniaria NRRL 30616]|uniref:Major facilitator superfamily transporter n=1 Tax=Coniochaeta ligniaria NRRL 30616 TaxID=1408157 RepID=A0A1J7JVP8_9PEZI|nr:major facilitator superfamily transporter [Coniochaeta ligniaria NRRL 30616]
MADKPPPATPGMKKDPGRSTDDTITVVTPHVARADDDDGSDAQSIAASIGNQRMLMPKKTLLIAIPALSVALFVSFIDQTGVSTSIPAVSAELDTGSATSWIGASFLIASTAFQLINGRLSDIFGRKNCLLLCLGLIALGDILAGFAKTKAQLFAFRAIAGVGGGGINSIVMIIVSDITTLENRGKYQGILGAVIALANGTGPFLGGALVEKLSWRWIFWLIPMLAVPAALTILFFLPVKHERGNYVAKVKMIDYGGIALNLAAVLLILIPLSGGGDMYAWSSGEFIGMITVGGVLAIAFVLYEWKLAPVPIMPLRLFQAPHCPSMYAQSIMMGIGFYGNFFYMPIYFQSVLGYGALESGALILPLIISTSACSIGSGQFMSRVGRYMPCIAVGFCLWTLGTGLKCMFGQTTPLWVVIVVLIVEGLGIGLTLQPTLVGLLANSRSEDRAVCTGLRNFIRTIGGAFGLIISGAILSNTLSSQLSGLPFISQDTISGLTSSTYGLDKLGLTADEREMVLAVYMKGLHYIFIFYAACVGSAFIMCAGIGNTSLKAKVPENKPPAEGTSQVQSESDASVGSEEKKEEARAEV